VSRWSVEGPSGCVTKEDDQREREGGVVRGAGAHPASCTMGTDGAFFRDKAAGA
jgi:hypothetical protein